MESLIGQTLGRYLVEAHLDLGHGDEALAWYRRAVEVGGAHEGILALRAARAAHELHREVAYGQFLRHGCDGGYAPACVALRERSRGRRRPGRNEGG